MSAPRPAADAPAGAEWTEPHGLCAEHLKAQARFAEFTRAHILPYADRWDREERLAPDVAGLLAEPGYLGSLVPSGYGGADLDAVEFGLLHEAVGYGCSSARSLLTVHSMVCQAIARWGGPQLRERWLPELAAGRGVAAFALTEPESGSDVASLAMAAEPAGGGYRLTGRKRWITCGQIASAFLVFARSPRGHAAFVVERDRPGLTVEPVRGLLGTRAAMTADLRFDGCVVPGDAMVGRPGFGLSAVAAGALEWGRYSVAWGCAGLSRACLDASARYAVRRRQFGKPIGEHQLVQGLVADMAVEARAARLLCIDAGRLIGTGDPQAVEATWTAKYFAAGAAFRAAAAAVQIHGANGCADGYPVQRYLRDAKIMEIIEGTAQIQQTFIADSTLSRYRVGAADPREAADE